VIRVKLHQSISGTGVKQNSAAIGIMIPNLNTYFVFSETLIPGQDCVVISSGFDALAEALEKAGGALLKIL
jgi:hypothetical protein